MIHSYPFLWVNCRLRESPDSFNLYIRVRKETVDSKENHTSCIKILPYFLLFINWIITFLFLLREWKWSPCLFINIKLVKLSTEFINYWIPIWILNLAEFVNLNRKRNLKNCFFILKNIFSLQRKRRFMNCALCASKKKSNCSTASGDILYPIKTSEKQEFP